MPGGIDESRRRDRPETRATASVDSRAHGECRDEEQPDAGRHHGKNEESRRVRCVAHAWPLDQDESPDTEGDRADEPGLERPEEVLRSCADEQQWQREHGRGEVSDTATHQDVRARDRDEVQHDHLGEIRQIGVEPNDVEGRSIQEERKRRPVLVGRSEVVEGTAVERDRAPLVEPEGQRSTQVEHEHAGDERADDER